MDKVAKQFDAAIQKLVPKFRKEVIAEKDRFIDDQLEYFGVHRNLSLDKLAVHKARMLEIFKKHYQPAMEVGIRYGLKMLPLKLKTAPVALEVKFSLLSIFMMDWISEFGGIKAQETSQTTFEDLNRLLTAAFADGQDIQQVIVAGLRAKDFSPYRADTIARTEIHQAALYASQRNTRRIAMEVGVDVKKRWIPVVDERTRINHSVMAGKTVNMDEFFIVGGERMQRPGDPNGSAGNTINCRCVLGYDID